MPIFCQLLGIPQPGFPHAVTLGGSARQQPQLDDSFPNRMTTTKCPKFIYPYKLLPPHSSFNPSLCIPTQAKKSGKRKTASNSLCQPSYKKSGGSSPRTQDHQTLQTNEKPQRCLRSPALSGRHTLPFPSPYLTPSWPHSQILQLSRYPRLISQTRN